MKPFTPIQLSFLFILLLPLCAQAQDYQTGIGLRGGFAGGITVKHFINNRHAVEGILTGRSRGFELTGLFEIHQQAFNTDRLQFFYGFGAHIGIWNGNGPRWGAPDLSYPMVGIDGIVGLEYSFREVPISLSLDWKPSLNFYRYPGFWGDGGALSVRYIF